MTYTGIGRAIVKGLSESGAKVIALSRTQTDLDTLIKEVIKDMIVE